VSSREIIRRQCVINLCVRTGENAKDCGQNRTSDSERFLHDFKESIRTGLLELRRSFSPEQGRFKSAFH
jgi:hypothetical protein